MDSKIKNKRNGVSVKMVKIDLDYITEWEDQIKIVKENMSIKKRVYKLLRKYNLSYGKIFSLFGIDEEDEDENRAIYLKRLFYQYIKEEM